MAEPDIDRASQRVADALADSLRAGELPGGGMLTAWYLVAETMDTDGHARPVMLCDDESHLSTLRGLIEHARESLRADFREWLTGSA